MADLLKSEFLDFVNIQQIMQKWLWVADQFSQSFTSYLPVLNHNSDHDWNKTTYMITNCFIPSSMGQGRKTDSTASIPNPLKLWKNEWKKSTLVWASSLDFFLLSSVLIPAMSSTALAVTALAFSSSSQRWKYWCRAFLKATTASFWKHTSEIHRV